MAHDLVLDHALVVTPTGLLRGGVAVDGEIITAVGASGTLGPGRREVDLEGRILFPGVIDPHVHFGIGDELGEEQMIRDFSLNTQDCLVGGVTTVITTTLIGSRPLTQLLSQAVDCGRDRSFCDFKFNIPVVAREQIADIAAVVRRGGVSFKFFTGYTGEQALGFGMNPEGVPPDMFHSACDAIAAAGPPAFAMIHAEEPTVREMNIERLCRDPASTGRELVAWAGSTPAWGESVQIFMYGQIAAHFGVTLYPVHVSSAHSLDTIRALRSRGVSILGETLVLFLSTTAEEMDVLKMGARAKIQPPIRHERDRDELWRALADDTISVVGTDSLGYSAAFRGSVGFWDARVGVNQQYADTVPLMMDRGYHGQRIDLARLAKVLSENAARRYGLYPRKGAIAPGSDADLVVIDPDRELTLGVARLRGTCDYSLWEGRRVRGAPVMTVLRGQVVMEDGEIVCERPSGQFIAGLR